MSETVPLPAIRVLLVDEDSKTRAAIADRIGRMEGMELAGAAGDVQGVRDLLHSAQTDVILLDLHQYDGQDGGVCRSIRALTDLPVIVLASFMTVERWQEASAAGATAYVLKNIDTEQLSREIKELTAKAGRGSGGGEE
ncbi:MAG: response regulator [Dehalococcoidia bacterium]